MSSQSTDNNKTTKNTGLLGPNLFARPDPGKEDENFRNFMKRRVTADMAKQAEANKTTPSDSYMGKDLNETDKPLWERPGREKAVRDQEAEAQKATTSNKANTASKS